MPDKDIVKEARELVSHASPAPWTEDGFHVKDAAKCVIASITAPIGTLTNEQLDANAALIARAPDLLRALADEVERLRRGFKDASGLANVKNEFWESAEKELDEIRACDKCDLCEDHHD